jgi:T5orf172 domain
VEGYVYVISKKAMPRLMKVGFTTRSPDERAAKLSGTHSPYPSIVEYSVWVSDARTLERKAHRRLSKVRAGKEWFKCSRERAIEAIESALDDLPQVRQTRVEIQAWSADENWRSAWARMEAEEAAKRERQAKEEEARKAEQREQVEHKYKTQMWNLSKTSLFPYWTGCAVAIAVVHSVLTSTTHLAGSLVGGAFLGGIPALCLGSLVQARKERSPQYLALVAHMQAELSEIDKKASTAEPSPSIPVLLRQRAAFTSTGNDKQKETAAPSFTEAVAGYVGESNRREAQRFQQRLPAGTMRRIASGVRR